MAGQTIKAKPRMVSALFQRQVAAKVETIRHLVESDHGCGQDRALQAAEARLFHGDVEEAARALGRIEDALAERADRARCQEDQAATARQAAARKETAESDEGGKISILERDGLMWLKRKRRLSDAEAMAAEKYRAKFDKVFRGPKTAQISDSPSGGSDRFADEKVQAVRDLDELRERLGRDAALIFLMDEVAGKGATLRDLAKGNQKDADRLEVEFKVACRLLAKKLGYKS